MNFVERINADAAAKKYDAQTLRTLPFEAWQPLFKKLGKTCAAG